LPTGDSAPSHPLLDAATPSIPLTSHTSSRIEGYSLRNLYRPQWLRPWRLKFSMAPQ
jgi:hypothetical protein